MGCITNGVDIRPMVRPSGRTDLYRWFAAFRPPPPSMYCITMVGFPGIYFWRKGTTALVRMLPTPPGALLSRMVTVFPWKKEVCGKAAPPMKRPSSSALRETLRNTADLDLSRLICTPVT